MQNISTITSPSKFVSEPHLRFAVDGVALDELLEDWYPNHGFHGLVPTTSNWLTSKVEQTVVWDRFLDRSSEWVSVPILCCPDDLDFSCSLAMVDARFSNDSVEWRAFGFDQTGFDLLPEEVGASVCWLPPKRPLIFARDEYGRVASEFQAWADSQATN